MGALETSIGRKLAMAASGQALLGFLVVHALGNASLLGGADRLNAYAEHLHAVPALVWGARAGLFALFALHIWQGALLALENRAAKPAGYAVTRHRGSTFSSRTMIWTGLVLAAFLGYHLLHFTGQVLEPELAAGSHPDGLGRPDVARMVVGGLARPASAAIYLLAMLALGVHLFHGVQSSFQTLGLHGERSFPWVVRLGRGTAAALAIAFVLVPAGILVGLLR